MSLQLDLADPGDKQTSDVKQCLYTPFNICGEYLFYKPTFFPFSVLMKDCHSTKTNIYILLSGSGNAHILWLKICISLVLNTQKIQDK